MAKKNVEENFDDDILVEMTDTDGNVFLYSEELIIPVDGENFALLIAIHEDDEEIFEDDDDVIIAKIILNEDGEEEYIEPTDEEFERVQQAYEKLMDEADEY